MAIAPPNMHPSENTIRRSFAPPSDAMRGAALIEREEMLVDEFLLVGEASYRRRQDIEVELSDIRRELELLGFPPHFLANWHHRRSSRRTPGANDRQRPRSV